MQWHIETDIIAFIAVSIILVSMIVKGNFNVRKNRDLRFCVCLFLFLFGDFVDLVSSVVFFTPVSDGFFSFTQTLYHLSLLPIIIGWFHYTIAVVFKDNRKVIMGTDIASAVIYGLFFIFVMLDIPFGYIFTVENGVYARGPLFFVPLALFSLYSVATLVVSFLGNTTRRMKCVLAIVPFLTAVGIALQLTVEGWLTITAFFSLGVLVAYLVIQADRADAAFKSIEIEATHDPLTGLGNRLYAERQITELLEAKESGALLMIDLDNLKIINDEYGHEAGDNVLRFLGSFLSQTFNDEKSVLSRYGGDEFLVYIPVVQDKEKITSKVSRFIFNLSLLKVPSYDDLRPTCSIGLTFNGPGSTSLEQLLREADSALYQVKRNGKNDFHVFSEETAVNVFHHTRVDDQALNHTEWFNPEDLRHTFAALSKFLPYIISINLTQNSYYSVENDPSISDRLPVYGAYDEFIKNACKVFHPADSDNILKSFSLEALKKAYNEEKTTVNLVVRHRSHDGSYRWVQSLCLFERATEGDVHACMFIRPYEEEHALENERLKLLKIFDVAVHTAFEYISIIDTESGLLTIYDDDGKNTHQVPNKGSYDEIVKKIATHFISHAEKEKYVSDASLSTIANEMEKHGQYEYHYRIGNEFRIVRNYYYEPTKSRILQTVSSQKA